MKDKFENWNILFIQYLKRDWKIILTWVIGLGLFCGGFVPALAEVTKGKGLVGLFETLQNPAMTFMVGNTPVKEATNYTLGAMYSHMMLLFCGIFAMVVSILQVVNHSRKEEENGLTEFMCTYSIGRHASSLALMNEIVVINFLLAGFTSFLMIVFGYESMGSIPSILFGLSVGLSGLIGAVFALLMSQIMVTSGGAMASSFGLVGVLYIIRGVTDVACPKLSLFNPMGWIYLTYPFTNNNWWLLLVGVIFSIIIYIISFELEKERDMGAGYLPEKVNSKRIKKSLLSVHGLLLRLNKGTIVGWLVALIILGSAYGSIYGDMQSFLNGNDILKQMFQMQGISIESSFTMTILVVLCGFATILPVTIINHLFKEETSGRFAQVFGTKTSRTKLYWTTIIISIIAGIFALLAATIGLGGAAVSVMKTHEMELLDFIKAGLNYLPAVLFVISLTSLALGWVPKLGKAIYGYIIYSMLLSYFLNIINIPKWIEKTGILNWIPRMPVEKFDLNIFLGITIFSIILLVVGYIGYKKRDLKG